MWIPSMIYSGSITRFKLIRRLVLLVIPPLLVKTSISRNATLIKLRSLVFIQTIPVFKIGALSHSPHLQKTISILFSTQLNRTWPYKLIQIYLVQIYGIYIGMIQWPFLWKCWRKTTFDLIEQIGWRNMSFCFTIGP